MTAAAPTAHYICDLEGHLLAEATGTSAATAVIVREYIWLEGLPVAVIDGVDTATPVTYYVHTDHLARPIRMTGQAKGSIWWARWRPFGAPINVDTAPTVNLRFPGQYFLIEQGLAYNWHRFYDPTTGRYTQPDPLGFPDGPARYAYALNSPLMRTDKFGLFDQGFNADPPGDHLGHGDFVGNNIFDYNAEDRDPGTQPYRNPVRHFRDLSDVEGDLEKDIAKCDPRTFERCMHQGQDYFVHYAKGWRWWTAGHIFGGHSPDHDDAAWRVANTWSSNWVQKWTEQCTCPKK